MSITTKGQTGPRAQKGNSALEAEVDSLVAKVGLSRAEDQIIRELGAGRPLYSGGDDTGAEPVTNESIAAAEQSAKLFYLGKLQSQAEAVASAPGLQREALEAFGPITPPEKGGVKKVQHE